ncbi:MAG: hypothetical protein IH840_03905 [Candidatus Heimdallarchaeota archaeon]|nr:hypothetical protein [Candidatus Heimdallarchaeota archaeon]
MSDAELLINKLNEDEYPVATLELAETVSKLWDTRKGYQLCLSIKNYEFDEVELQYKFNFLFVNSLIWLGELEEAEVELADWVKKYSLSTTSANLKEDIVDNKFSWLVSFTRAQLLLSKGDYDQAIQEFTHILNLNVGMKGTYYESEFLLGIAYAYYFKGKINDSFHYMNESHDQAVSNKNVPAKILSSLGLAFLYQNKGQLDLSIKTLEETENYLKEHSLPFPSFVLAMPSHSLARISLAKNDFKTAQTHLLKSLSQFKTIDEKDAFWLPDIIFDAIRTHTELNKIEEAKAYLSKLKNLQASESKVGKYRVMVAEALILLQGKRLYQKMKAYSLLKEAIDSNVGFAELEKYLLS